MRCRVAQPSGLWLEDHLDALASTTQQFVEGLSLALTVSSARVAEKIAVSVSVGAHVTWVSF